MASKEYVFLNVDSDGLPLDEKIRESSESKGLSEEIQLAMEETGIQAADLVDRANADALIEELLKQGFRPTIFIPADQYLDLALELGTYGVEIPKELKVSRKVVNAGQENTMVHGVKTEQILKVNRGLVTLGRTPFVKEAGYIVELDIPREEIRPILTAAPGSKKDAFRGVIALKSEKIRPEQMKVIKVIAPAGQKAQVMDLQNKLASAIKEMK